MKAARKWSIFGTYMLIFAFLTPRDAKDLTVVFDRRLRTIAGETAHNCGTVGLNVDSAPFNKCVRKSFSLKQPFYVRYDLPSSDYYAGVGLAANREGLQCIRCSPALQAGITDHIEAKHISEYVNRWYLSGRAVDGNLKRKRMRPDSVRWEILPHVCIECEEEASSEDF